MGLSVSEPKRMALGLSFVSRMDTPTKPISSLVPTEFVQPYTPNFSGSPNLVTPDIPVGEAFAVALPLSLRVIWGSGGAAGGDSALRPCKVIRFIGGQQRMSQLARAPTTSEPPSLLLSMDGLTRSQR
jgi:hypothetical protein